MKEVLAKAESKMGKTIARLESDYAAIRAGRANPAVLDKVMVDYYGAPTPVNQLAAVSVAEARVLTIQPWDGSVCRAIERAIQTSDIGINPQSDGKTIRLIFPPLTEEKRKDIVKDVSHMAEEAKIALRSIRRDAMEKLKAMKKDGELTEDDLKQAEKKTQELTDKYVKQADERSAAKQKEVLTPVSKRKAPKWHLEVKKTKRPYRCRHISASSWTATVVGQKSVVCRVRRATRRARRISAPSRGMHRLSV